MFHWSKLIAGVQDETFGIPADVVFEIVESDELHEIRAHKWLLAMVSLPFRTMFYTTEVGNKAAETFKIEQTTAPAFQVMMDAIYETKSIEDSLKGKSVQEVFDVMNLIEQYQISELAEAVQKLLANYPVDDDTVMEVAEEATEYTTTFQKEAKQLLFNCAKFLEPKLKDAKSIFKYAAKTDQKEVFSILLGMVNEMLDEMKPVQCLNCKYENCRDGNTIGEDEFREGLIVTNNRAINPRRANFWSGNDWGTGRVTEVNQNEVKVEPIKQGFANFGICEWLKSSYGNPNFLYFCK